MEREPLLSRPKKATFKEFLKAFWPICLISFGGPQAHVALLHQKFVDVPVDYTGPQMKEATFLELYALASSLPGPGSTQLVCSMGASFGGLIGSFITFFIWQVPGFIVMTAAGLWFHKHVNDPNSVTLINAIADYAVGLISAAFAFVLLAAFKIVSKTCSNDIMKMIILLTSMFVGVTIPFEAASWVYISLLVGGGAAFYIYDKFFPNEEEETVDQFDPDWEANISPFAGGILIAIVAFITFIVIIIPSDSLGNIVLKIFWRIGLLVFGGGVVVIPMLINELVATGFLPTTVFLAGFGLFGMIPGPMFNLAPFLGAAIAKLPGAFYGSLGLFGPGCLLQIGLLPYWERLRKVKTVKTILHGTNAAAVGLIVTGVWLLMKTVLTGATAYALICSAGALTAVYGTSPVRIIVSHGLIGVVLVFFKIGGPYHLVETVREPIFPSL